MIVSFQGREKIYSPLKRIPLRAYSIAVTLGPRQDHALP
jgi:hypothetical protein